MIPTSPKEGNFENIICHYKDEGPGTGALPIPDAALLPVAGGFRIALESALLGFWLKSLATKANVPAATACWNCRASVVLRWTGC